MSKPTSSWRELIKVHPAADLFPMMAPEELDALAEDIKTNGLQNPVATWFDKDEVEWLIDGRNRLDALERLGYKFSRVEHNAAGVCTATKLKIRNPNRRKDTTGRDCTALDDEWAGLIHQYRETHTCGTFGWPIADPYTLAAMYNLHRRHLSIEDRKRIAAELLKANPERSDRSVAKETKLSPTTVGEVRKEVGASTVQSGQSQPAKRVGADGKARKLPERKEPSAGKVTKFDLMGSQSAPAAEEPRATTPAVEPAASTSEPAGVVTTADADIQRIVELHKKIVAAEALAALVAAWNAAPADVQDQFLALIMEKPAVATAGPKTEPAPPTQSAAPEAATPTQSPAPKPAAAAATWPADPPMDDWSAGAAAAAEKPMKTREQTIDQFKRAGEMGLGILQMEVMRIDDDVVDALVAEGMVEERDGRWHWVVEELGAAA